LRCRGVVGGFNTQRPAARVGLRVEEVNRQYRAVRQNSVVACGIQPHLVARLCLAEGGDSKVHLAARAISAAEEVNRQHLASRMGLLVGEVNKQHLRYRVSSAMVCGIQSHLVAGGANKAHRVDEGSFVV
jgi:hypothetical protein